MGGSRLFGWSLDGIAEQHKLNIVTYDRPSSGGSTACALAHRVEWSHYALLAILDALPTRPTTFSVLSHSNGLIYALYTLLHLPSHLSVKSWHLTSAYVAPWLSGSVPLTLARMLPAQATAQFGLLAGSILRTVGPIGNIGSWSAGFARASSGLSGLIASATEAPAGDVPADTPERELARFKFRNAARPAHKRLYGRYYYSQACVDLASKFTLAEGTDALGPEALLSFRIGGGDLWGWGGPEGNEEMAGAELGTLYERGFEALGRRMAARGERIRIQVVFGAQDGLVPEQGRDYLRDLLVEKLALVAEDDWTEVDGAGHDEVRSVLRSTKT